LLLYPTQLEWCNLLLYQPNKGVRLEVTFCLVLTGSALLLTQKSVS